MVENAGNHPVTVSLHGRDRDGDVAVALDPSVIELAGGANAAATATVSPSRPSTARLLWPARCRS